MVEEEKRLYWMAYGANLIGIALRINIFNHWLVQHLPTKTIALIWVQGKMPSKLFVAVESPNIWIFPNLISAALRNLIQMMKRKMFILIQCKLRNHPHHPWWSGLDSFHNHMDSKEPITSPTMPFSPAEQDPNQKAPRTEEASTPMGATPLIPI